MTAMKPTNTSAQRAAGAAPVPEKESARVDGGPKGNSEAKRLLNFKAPGRIVRVLAYIWDVAPWALLGALLGDVLARGWQ